MTFGKGSYINYPIEQKRFIPMKETIKETLKWFQIDGSKGKSKVPFHLYGKAQSGALHRSQLEAQLKITHHQTSSFNTLHKRIIGRNYLHPLEQQGFYSLGYLK